ncbi:hypothetical protein PCURB6_43910 [Paenibacillus curdlanolyticus]|nr:hypothetical protein PCURB6_43910 [Paenibacillus curdlanolyticus]
MNIKTLYEISEITIYLKDDYMHIIEAKSDNNAWISGIFEHEYKAQT